MQLDQLVETLDAKVVAGDIIGAFEQFAADNVITHSNPNDITHSKSDKLQGLRWFFGNIAQINRIERPAVQIVGQNETHSQFTFDFTNHQGEQLVYSEVIRRVWANNLVTEEQYLLGQTLQPAAKKTTKKAGAAADVVAEPAAKKTVEVTKAAAKAPAVKKAAAPKKEKAVAATPAKADDLTIIEGIGPKIAELLVVGGISTFAQLAAAKPAAIKAILEAAGKRYQMHDPATWPKQATLARDGKTAELTKLQNELKGGK
jgi:predicted flap endonuclease-1-like 5' DNA nuclease